MLVISKERLPSDLFLSFIFCSCFIIMWVWDWFGKEEGAHKLSPLHKYLQFGQISKSLCNFVVAKSNGTKKWFLQKYLFHAFSFLVRGCGCAIVCVRNVGRQRWLDVGGLLADNLHLFSVLYSHKRLHLPRILAHTHVNITIFFHFYRLSISFLFVMAHFYSCCCVSVYSICARQHSPTSTSLLLQVFFCDIK